MSTHSGDPPDRAAPRRGHYLHSPLRGALLGGHPEAPRTVWQASILANGGVVM